MKSRDYEEFIACLNSTGVRYLIVGAHAVAFHARPRATKDLDVFLEPTRDNGDRVLEAVRQFMGTDLGLTPDDLSTPGRIVQLGVAPTRIDLLAKLAGDASFEDLWHRRVEAVFGDVPAKYLSLADLISEKAVAGRDQDKADLRVLRKVSSRRA